MDDKEFRHKINNMKKYIRQIIKSSAFVKYIIYILYDVYNIINI